MELAFLFCLFRSAAAVKIHLAASALRNKNSKELPRVRRNLRTELFIYAVQQQKTHLKVHCDCLQGWSRTLTAYMARKKKHLRLTLRNSAIKNTQPKV